MNELTVIENAVLNLLPIGATRKIQLRDIEDHTSLDKRSIYQIINNLTRKGIPVVAKRNGRSEDRGYYIATNEEERREGTQGFKEQINDMLRRLEYVEKADLNNWNMIIKRPKTAIEPSNDNQKMV